MKYVFVDTLYWVALSLPGDSWYHPAVAAAEQVMNMKMVTTEEVLAEYLTALSGSGSYYRSAAASTVRDMYTDPDILVIPSSHDNFIRGVSLYEQRLDKGYSLTDCISMNVCKELDITHVLTSDHHFKQEGYSILIVQ